MQSPGTGRELVATWKKLTAFTPDLDERAALLSVIAQPTRLRLFYRLDQRGEVCVCDVGEILGVTHSSVSQHLARFKVHGLVMVRRDAQPLHYRLSASAATRRRSITLPTLGSARCEGAARAWARGT